MTSTPTKPTVAFAHLAARRIVDTEHMVGLLAEAASVTPMNDAAVVVVNTCSFFRTSAKNRCAPSQDWRNRARN